MKILQVSPYIDPRLGGQERYVLALSKTLSRLGHDVTILTCGNCPKNVSKDYNVIKIPSKKIMDLHLLSVKELARFLNGNRFDVVHLHHQSLFGEIALIVNKIYGLPTVITLHSLMLRRMPAKFLYDRTSLGFISLLSKKVICLSPRIMQSFGRRGLDLSKCVVIPNAIDVASLENRFQSIQRELHEHEFDLLFVGRLEKRKGILWLIQCLTLLHNKGKKVTLKIVGKGPLEDELLRIIYTNDLQKHVHLLGYVPEEKLLKLFLIAKCVVIPSLYEGVPGVALESMAARKPLIVSDIPGLSELVVNEANGLLVNPMDTQGLAFAIDKILTDPTCLNSLNDINEKLLVRYDWQATTHKILDTYQNVLIDA